MNDLRAAAAHLTVRAQILDVRRPADLPGAFQAAVRAHGKPSC